MTAPDVLGMMRAIETHALESGLFDSVLRHEPKKAPGKGLAFACWLNSLGPARGQSGLAVTTALVTFSARIYIDMFRDPESEIDADLGNATSLMMTAFSGDLTLGGLARNMDALGQCGPPLSASAGYLDHDNRKFRAMVINLPYIVNDAWPQALEV